MKDNKSKYVCSSCGWESLGWVGKCSNCAAFGTLEEDKSEVEVQNTLKNEIRTHKFSSLSNIDISIDKRLNSGFSELDLVLGGGFVEGSVILLTGNPGIGKSTLALNSILKNNILACYISGEESIMQVAKRAKRLEGVNQNNIDIIESKNIENILKDLKKKKYKIIVWDSIQSFFSYESTGILGGVTQIRNVCSKIVDYTRETNVISIIIGQVTKEGNIAGPKLIEHMVDVVLLIEQLKDSELRILRASKNRFGSTMEAGLIKMKDNGFEDVDDYSSIFSTSDENIVGSIMTPILEGTRVIPVEIQALVVPTVFGFPQRRSNGVDRQRLELLVAVICKHLKLPLSQYDIFLNVSGGIKINETSADLAIIMSIISSYRNVEIDRKNAFSAEISLNGILILPRDIERRYKSCKKIGFEKLISKNVSQAYGMKEYRGFKNIIDIYKYYFGRLKNESKVDSHKESNDL